MSLFSTTPPTYNTTIAKDFIKENLPNLSLISTYVLGNKVFNLRDKESNKVIGFLAYLVSYNKLTSLVNYVFNKSKF